MRKQISAFERLRTLPPVFRGADLTVRFQWTSKQASHYLYLWKNRGLVDGLGGKSDVFANRLVSVDTDWEQAVAMAMPSAVIVGLESLRRAGWSTQIPSCPSVAVRVDGPVFTLNQFTVETRPDSWFASMRDQAFLRPARGLPVLKPAWALAELLSTKGWGDCGLWPDDLELDEMTPQDEVDWHAACSFFKLPESELVDQAEASR